MECKRCGKKAGTYLCSECKNLVCSKCKKIKNNKTVCLDCLKTSKKTKIERPVGVALIAVIGLLFSSFSIIYSLLSIGTSSFDFVQLEIDGSLQYYAAVIFILLVDVGQFVVSYGLWKMKKWSYYIEIGVIIFNTSLRIVDMLLFPPLLFGLGIPIAVILYLRSKRHLFL